MGRLTAGSGRCRDDTGFVTSRFIVEDLGRFVVRYAGPGRYRTEWVFSAFVGIRPRSRSLKRLVVGRMNKCRDE